MISNDLIFGTDGDLSIVNGDFEIAQSDDQNIEAIILAEKGQFYQFPLLGYGITTKLKGPFSKLTEKKLIREALKRDNYNVTTLTISDDFEVTVDAVKTK